MLLSKYSRYYGIETMAEIRINTEGKRQYYDDAGQHVAELDDMLDDLTASVNLTLRPVFPPSFNTENEFSKLDSIESEIARRNTSNKKVLYSHFTYDENNLPEEIRDLGVKITRDPLLFITVTKDAHGKLQYSAERRNADGSYTAIDNYNPNAARFTGLVNGKREIKLEEQIFLYDDDVKDDLLRQFPSEQLKLDKQRNLLHELQHISNKIKIAQMQTLKPKSNCSIADYYRLEFYDEISASLKPLLEEIADENHNNPSYQWFYDAISQQGKDIKNIQPQEIFQTLVAYWNQQFSDGYAKKNSQFFKNVQGFVKYTPWASYQIQDGSEDYLKSLKAMLTIDGTDYSQFLSPTQDPITAHKNKLEYTLSDGTQKNWLQELEEKAREIRKKAAQYGIDEEIAVKLKDRHTIYPLNPKAPFEPQELELPQEEPVNNDEKSFYRAYFKLVAKKNYLEYNEDENSPIYKVSLKEQSGAATHISINNSRNIIMKATDTNGQPKVPDYDRFDDIVRMTKEQGCNVINFGNISSNEYRARLYLACLKANMRMKNAPELNAEFWASVDPATKKAITDIKLTQTKEQCKNIIENKLGRPLNNTGTESEAFEHHCQKAFAQENNISPMDDINKYHDFAINKAENIDETKLGQYVVEYKKAKFAEQNVITTVKRLEEDILPKIEEVSKAVGNKDGTERQQQYGYHGFEHSELVALRAIDCAKSIGKTSKEELLAITLAAAIHDSMRTDNSYNENHGPDAAKQKEVIEFVESFGLSEEYNKLILAAAKGHTTDTPAQKSDGNWIRDCLCDGDRIRLAWDRGYDEQYFFTERGKEIGSLEPQKALEYLRNWDSFCEKNDITLRYGKLSEKYQQREYNGKNVLGFVKRENRNNGRATRNNTAGREVTLG